MKRAVLGLAVAGLIGAAVAWSNNQASRPELEFKLEGCNPVSHLRLNNDPNDFQFAIVSDRTGGHRPKIFSRAVEHLNLMQPEFVLCVGDLIEGYTEDSARLAAEWREFQGFVSRLQMPFFYVPGNHDLANLTEEKVWKEKFGRRYYDFVYRDVLFLLLSSEDPPGRDPGSISADQLAFIKQSLSANRDVRWTLVFLHKPMWAHAEAEKSGWIDVEQLLNGRPYTVFAGHVHRYQKFVRQGQNYYQLATTGGGSKLRGTTYGEFDHIVWVTMKKEGPTLANVLLDGIMPEDLRKVETDEPGVPMYNRRPTVAAGGKITLDGQPVANAYVALVTDGKAPVQARADAFTDAEGRFTLSTYTAHDGIPTGEYVATVVCRKPLWTPEGKPGPNTLPDRYARRDMSPLKVTIKAGVNNLALDLQK